MLLSKKILNASIEEKLTAIEQLWDSIDFEKTSIPILPAQQKEAKKRLLKMKSEGGKSLTLSQLKKNIAKRYAV
jgi:putative addiction module component (TIGR02574 family)